MIDNKLVKIISTMFQIARINGEIKMDNCFFNTQINCYMRFKNHFTLQQETTTMTGNERPTFDPKQEATCAKHIHTHTHERRSWAMPQCLTWGTATESVEDENAEHTDRGTHITTNRMAEVTVTLKWKSGLWGHRRLAATSRAREQVITWYTKVEYEWGLN